jgi:hypothetical protein
MESLEVYLLSSYRRIVSTNPSVHRVRLRCGGHRVVCTAVSDPRNVLSTLASYEEYGIISNQMAFECNQEVPELFENVTVSLEYKGADQQGNHNYSVAIDRPKYQPFVKDYSVKQPFDFLGFRESIEMVDNMMEQLLQAKRFKLTQKNYMLEFIDEYGSGLSKFCFATNRLYNTASNEEHFLKRRAMFLFPSISSENPSALYTKAGNYLKYTTNVYINDLFVVSKQFTSKKTSGDVEAFVDEFDFEWLFSVCKGLIWICDNHIFVLGDMRLERQSSEETKIALENEEFKQDIYEKLKVYVDKLRDIVKSVNLPPAQILQMIPSSMHSRNLREHMEMLITYIFLPHQPAENWLYDSEKLKAEVIRLRDEVLQEEAHWATRGCLWRFHPRILPLLSNILTEALSQIIPQHCVVKFDRANSLASAAPNCTFSLLNSKGAGMQLTSNSLIFRNGGSEGSFKIAWFEEVLNLECPSLSINSKYLFYSLVRKRREDSVLVREVWRVPLNFKVQEENLMRDLILQIPSEIRGCDSLDADNYTLAVFDCSKPYDCGLRVFSLNQSNEKYSQLASLEFSSFDPENWLPPCEQYPQGCYRGLGRVKNSFLYDVACLNKVILAQMTEVVDNREKSKLLQMIYCFKVHGQSVNFVCKYFQTIQEPLFRKSKMSSRFSSMFTVSNKYFIANTCSPGQIQVLALVNDTIQEIIQWHQPQILKSKLLLWKMGRSADLMSYLVWNKRLKRLHAIFKSSDIQKARIQKATTFLEIINFAFKFN